MGAHTRGEAALAALASRQHGVVSRAELAELGFGASGGVATRSGPPVAAAPPRRVRRGHTALTQTRARASRCVRLRARGTAESTARPGGGWGCWARPGAPIDATASRGCKPKPGVRVHRTRMVHPDDRIVVDGIAVTSMARTLVDLADVLDELSLAAAVNEAEVMRHFDLRAIERTQARLPGRRGRHRLRRVLATYTEAPGYCTTEAERLFLDLCGRHALPPPRRVSIAGYELDFYWDDARLAIEIDGATYHGHAPGFPRGPPSRSPPGRPRHSGRPRPLVGSRPRRAGAGARACRVPREPAALTRVPGRGAFGHEQPRTLHQARAALDAICDTFVPGGDGLPSATELGVPEALLGVVARNPRAAERKQVAQLLGLWNTRLLCAIAGGGVRRFSSRRRLSASRCCCPGRTVAWSSAAPRSRPCARARCSPTTGRAADNGAATRPGTRSAIRGRSARRRTRRRARSSRSRSPRTPGWNATSLWSARAPAAGPPRPCSPVPGSTS